MNDSIHNEIRDYYASTFAKYGPDPRGVDWNGRESQFVRFTQLLKLVESDPEPWSINDLGCGYGAIVEILNNNPLCHSYYGYDLVQNMIDYANSRWENCKMQCKFQQGNNMSISDYTVASGIFNIKENQLENKWLNHIFNTIDTINKASKKGFAFNMLTAYSDITHMKPNLYYCDPTFIFTYCKKMISKNVALLHDYNLYEFTIIVKK